MDWLQALGWAGSALLVYSLLQSRVLRFRALNLLACVVLVGFNAALGIWPMVAMNVVLCAINVWFIRSLVSQRHDERVYQAVEVDPDDAYLRHVLRRHRDDIHRHFPALSLEPTAGRTAYLVLTGDETAGVVLVRDVGDGIAHVELDYVTPKFRDFTPGEFVFRRSGLFQRHGFRRVVTPTGMVEPYYDRLGFRRQGDAYVLDLR